MRWEIDGGLLEVQGCIERARDIIERNQWKVSLAEESRASASYTFTHECLGAIGSIKISVLPQNRTEVYGYSPIGPDTQWLVEYLPRNILIEQLGDLLIRLIMTYAWQIKQGVIHLDPIERIRKGLRNEKIDMGWDKFGLADFELQRQAHTELEKWRQTIHKRQIEEFEQVADVILTQIRLDGLSLVLYDGKQRSGKFLQSMSLASTPQGIIRKPLKSVDDSGVVQADAGKPEKPTIKDTRILAGKYDELVLLWVNRPYIPKQTKDEFLGEHAGELGRKSFDRVLKDAYKRGIIGKDPGKHGRYKPKTVS